MVLTGKWFGGSRVLNTSTKTVLEIGKLVIFLYLQCMYSYVFEIKKQIGHAMLRGPDESLPSYNKNRFLEINR